MDSSTFAIIFLVFFSAWYIFYWLNNRKFWKAARLIPGPKPLPLIGNALLFCGDIHKIFPKLLKLSTDFDSICRTWLFDQLLVMLSDPADIKCVFGNPRLINRDVKLSMAILPFFGDGLFSNGDNVWKVQRKLMNPMFHHKVLESYVEIFGAKVKILMDKLEQVADGTSFDINKKLSLCTLDAICETFVGFSTNTQDAQYSELLNAHYTANQLIFRRLVYPWLLIPWLYTLTSDGRKAKEVIETIDAFNSDIISRKLAAYRKGDRRPGIKTGSGKTVTSFLDMLFDASEAKGSILTDKEILDEVTTMTAAGLVTTSVTMSVLLILIAIHPEWQDALYAEMSDVFADDMTRPVTYLDIPKMPVLDRVIRETLRMYPMAPLIPREITEEVTLPSGYTLPAGSSALVVNYIVHRDPKNYPEPDKFLPDRWLPGSGTNKHSHAYLPFGAGLRNCIGQKYAIFQMKSTLSPLVRQFKMASDLTMGDLEKLELTVNLRLPPGAYQLKLEKREI